MSSQKTYGGDYMDEKASLVLFLLFILMVCGMCSGGDQVHSRSSIERLKNEIYKEAHRYMSVQDIFIPIRGEKGYKEVYIRLKNGRQIPFHFERCTERSLTQGEVIDLFEELSQKMEGHVERYFTKEEAGKGQREENFLALLVIIPGRK